MDRIKLGHKWETPYSQCQMLVYPFTTRQTFKHSMEPLGKNFMVYTQWQPSACFPVGDIVSSHMSLLKELPSHHS